MAAFELVLQFRGPRVETEDEVVEIEDALFELLGDGETLAGPRHRRRRARHPHRDRRRARDVRAPAAVSRARWTHRAHGRGATAAAEPRHAVATQRRSRRARREAHRRAGSSRRRCCATARHAAPDCACRRARVVRALLRPRRHALLEPAADDAPRAGAQLVRDDPRGLSQRREHPARHRAQRRPRADRHLHALPFPPARAGAPRSAMRSAHAYWGQGFMHEALQRLAALCVRRARPASPRGRHRSAQRTRRRERSCGSASSRKATCASAGSSPTRSPIPSCTDSFAASGLPGAAMRGSPMIRRATTGGRGGHLPHLQPVRRQHHRHASRRRRSTPPRWRDASRTSMSHARVVRRGGRRPCRGLRVRVAMAHALGVPDARSRPPSTSRTRRSGSGIGRALYDALLRRARAARLPLRHGRHCAAQPRQRRAARGMGFAKVAHFREVGWKFGRWIDVGYWQRML